MRKFLMLSVAIGGIAVAGCEPPAAAPAEETTTEVAPSEGAMEAPAEGAAPDVDAAPVDAGESSGGTKL